MAEPIPGRTPTPSDEARNPHDNSSRLLPEFRLRYDEIRDALKTNTDFEEPEIVLTAAFQAYTDTLHEAGHLGATGDITRVVAGPFHQDPSMVGLYTIIKNEVDWASPAVSMATDLASSASFAVGRTARVSFQYVREREYKELTEKEQAQEMFDFEPSPPRT